MKGILDTVRQAKAFETPEYTHPYSPQLSGGNLFAFGKTQSDSGTS
jgi:hypothetical protein